MEIRKTLAFSKEEYQDRLRRVRETMAEKGLDALIVHTPENICYLAGYHTPGYYFFQVLVVPIDKDPVLITRMLEKGNMSAFSWMELGQGIGYSDTENATEVTAKALQKLGLAERRIGFDRLGFFFPIDRYEHLKTLLPKAKFEDGSLVVEKQRAVKSPKELDYIRQACRISAKGFQAIVDNARPGMTESQLAGHIHKALVENGGEYTGLPVFLSSGHRTLIPHATWTEKVIEAGDNIYCELTGCVKRYAGPLLRPTVLGKPSKALADYAAVCVEMIETVIQAVRPGTTSHEVDAAVRRVLVKHGFPTEKKVRTGYSIGLNFPPDWGEGYFLDLKQGDQTVLKPRMVFHCPQSPRVPDVPGVCVSETILVTDRGSEALTDFPRKLLVVQ